MTDGAPARNWVGEAVALAAHAALIADLGGLAGVRDRNALASALARPHNLSAYAEPDIADLAAAYAYGIIRNDPFADGNKRTGYALALVFLLDNGFAVTGTDVEAVEVILSVAAGTTTEAALAAWFRTHLQPA